MPAQQQLGRLFPNGRAAVPDATEQDPSSDVDDDFDTDEGLAQRDAEYERAAAAATAAGVPARRSSRAGTGPPRRRRWTRRERGSGRRCPLIKILLYCMVTVCVCVVVVSTACLNMCMYDCTRPRSGRRNF